MRRRAVNLIEVAVVLVLAGIVATFAVVGFRGGDVVGSDRAAQADADAVVDAATRIVRATGALPSDASALNRALKGSPQVVNAPTVSTPDGGSVGVVSVDLDPDAGTLGLASAGADGSCWLLRFQLTAAVGERPRTYGIAPAGSSLPCHGASAAALTLTGGSLGAQWNEPQVLA